MIALFDVKLDHVLMWIQKLFSSPQILLFFVDMFTNITQIEY